MGLGFADGFKPSTPITCLHTPDASIVGTHKVDEIQTTRKELTEIFGKPLMMDDYKVTTEWILTFNLSDGTEVIATIYDYKEANTPGLNDVITWSIGGYTAEAGNLVHQFIDNI